MPATTTLSTTTLSQGLDRSSVEVKVASASGLVPGKRLFVDGEVMEVVRLLVDQWVLVLRGVDGTLGSAHLADSTVYVADASQLQQKDPVGLPPAVILVSPWINVRNGKVWFARGDALPEGLGLRWWEEQAPTYTTGPTGNPIVTLSPTSST